MLLYQQDEPRLAVSPLWRPASLTVARPQTALSDLPYPSVAPFVPSDIHLPALHRYEGGTNPLNIAPKQLE
jgi:hypothetical protein